MKSTLWINSIIVIIFSSVHVLVYSMISMFFFLPRLSTDQLFRINDLLVRHMISNKRGVLYTVLLKSEHVSFFFFKSICFQSCCSIDEHLQEREGKQPYILAVGRTQNRIDTFYIAVDKQLISFQATSSLSAFDELFKSHYVFNLSYDEALVHLYSFVQTTIFNIDVTSTDESPPKFWMRTMFKCFICQTLHNTSQALISHLRLGHSFYPSTKFKLACSQDGCGRQFSTYSGLKKHLNSVHGEDSCQSGDAETSESFQDDFDSL